MKKEELRIGNKVDCFGIKEVDSIIRSTNGSFKLIVCEKKQSGVSIFESVLIESIELKPIPLTEEILLKCGFERVTYNSEETGYGTEYVFIRGGYAGFRIEYCDDFSAAIMGNENDQGVTPNVDVLCYLHQLQNLYFALTNEELKIEL